MTILKEKLEQAFEAKQNDVKSFIWKYEKGENGEQKSVKMMDATPTELQNFYDRCNMMLYNNDPNKPGRYVLLDIIEDQRRKCLAELFIKNLENGSICADGRAFQRRLYIHDIREIMNRNRESFPSDELGKISISAVTGGLSREFERLSIQDVLDAGLYNLGIFDNKHITFGFIINMGIYVTKEEMNELNLLDKDHLKKKPELIKEKLGLKPSVNLVIKPSGLTMKEMKAMLNLRRKKYFDLTTEQLNILLNKVLFRLENEINYHIRQWEERKRQIELVAEKRGIKLQ